MTTDDAEAAVEAVSRVAAYWQQNEIRRRRAEVDTLVAAFKSVDDDDLLARYAEEWTEFLALSERMEPRGKVVFPSLSINIMRHVIWQRGLAAPLDAVDLEHQEWIARELAHPGGLQ